MSEQEEIIQIIKEWLDIISRQVSKIIEVASKYNQNIRFEVAPYNSKIGIALIAIDELLDQLSPHFSEEREND